MQAWERLHLCGGSWRGTRSGGQAFVEAAGHEGAEQKIVYASPRAVVAVNDRRDQRLVLAGQQAAARGD